MPNEALGPFLIEEQQLLSGVSRHITSFYQRKSSSEEIRNINENLEKYS